ncbi:MAG: 50S ribosomal protein L23 [Acidobacteria bacterium]|nr:50S ribosomal protein L23 [Acidobacteriota bacterium]
MTPYEVLRGPLVTEKSETIRAEEKTLCFRVHKDATKTDIRNAVRKVFKVEVEDVRTINYSGKMKRKGRYAGYRPDWKKAYVKLKAGQKMVEYAQI